MRDRKCEQTAEHDDSRQRPLRRFKYLHRRRHEDCRCQNAPLSPIPPTLQPPPSKQKREARS